MPHLFHQTCFNHAHREAVARCPECAHHYCRECVTEHEDRVICAACLRKLARTPLHRRAGFAGIAHLLQWLASVLFLWFLFYLVGVGLASMPDSFHEGTLWRLDWLQRP